MKWIELKEILDEQYPAEAAMIGDIIGELIPVKEEVKKLVVTLDVTLDVIAEAVEEGADLIVAHHPLWWGDKEEAFEKDPLLQAMYDMVKNAGIGLYAIHTNADYAPNSLAYMQALAIDLENVEQSAGNQSVTGFLREPSTVEELSDLLKVTLQLEEVEFRSNIGPNEPVHKITISSGAAGEYGINSQDPEALHIVGEVKHHEWVRAKQLDIKVLELSHYSEIIFKHMIDVLLDKEEVEVIISREENGYKII